MTPNIQPESQTIISDNKNKKSCNRRSGPHRALIPTSLMIYTFCVFKLIIILITLLLLSLLTELKEYTVDIAQFS